MPGAPADASRNASLAAERANQRNVVIACFLGWTLDAFDFFVVTFVVIPIANDFHESIVKITGAIAASLFTRPIGAFIFGLLADRYGRRLPLVIDILFYSVVEILSGLAPSYSVFIALRLLYGIGMGGEWGVGASLAMESVPAKSRGIVSGLLQEGYAFGNLLAAIAFWLVYPHFGWRPLFFIGSVPALLTLLILFKVKESETWRQTAKHADWSAYWRAVAGNWKLFAYLIALMAMVNFISHGTQDLYPTFLQSQRGYSPGMTTLITVISMVGAIAGGLLVGLYSDRRGRRRAMIVAAILAIVLIPLWIAAPNLPLILLGAFLMQFMVQGAWGVIPAHINELSPDTLRGFFPGFAYQVGVLIASGSAYIEAMMGRHMTYSHAMGLFALIVLFFGAIVIGCGPEAHRIPFGRANSESSPPA
ncbi:MAG TPA: MFS transporter [Candidatus Acidoferrales bacterium]|nr:MFS transporter [Candidatus Acidoferrales bacterium]